MPEYMKQTLTELKGKTENSTIIGDFNTFCFKIVWLHCVACRILVPQSGTEYRPLVVKVQVLITGPPGNFLPYPINQG